MVSAINKGLKSTFRGAHPSVILAKINSLEKELDVGFVAFISLLISSLLFFSAFDLLSLSIILLFSEFSFLYYFFRFREKSYLKDYYQKVIDCFFHW